jgi:hypothetical protein
LQGVYVYENQSSSGDGLGILKKIIKIWLPIAVVIIGLCSLVYLVVQQSLRQGLNDPQIQLAEDAAISLSSDTDPAVLLPPSMVDVSQSLAPFMIIYAEDGEVLASSGTLYSETPTLPPGVLDYTREHGQDRVTWQPETGVRIAAVIVFHEGSHPGFVLAGRNMREVEKRETQTEQLSMLAMAGMLVASLMAVTLGEIFLQGKPSI